MALDRRARAYAGGLGPRTRPEAADAHTLRARAEQQGNKQPNDLQQSVCMQYTHDRPDSSAGKISVGGIQQRSRGVYRSAKRAPTWQRQHLMFNLVTFEHMFHRHCLAVRADARCIYTCIKCVLGLWAKKK